MRNAVSWAGSLFRALSLEVSLTLTGSLRTPLRRDAWSLSALHKACQACLLTVCGRVRAGQRDWLCQRNTGKLQFDAKGEKISALRIHTLDCMCFMCLCSMLNIFSSVLTSLHFHKEHKSQTSLSQLYASYRGYVWAHIFVPTKWCRCPDWTEMW